MPSAGLLMGINYGFDEVRFGEPVPVGSRIRAGSVPAAVTRRGTAVQITNRVTVEVEGRVGPALTALWVVRAEYAG